MFVSRLNELQVDVVRSGLLGQVISWVSGAQQQHVSQYLTERERERERERDWLRERVWWGVVEREREREIGSEREREWGLVRERDWLRERVG